MAWLEETGSVGVNQLYGSEDTAALGGDQRPGRGRQKV